MAALDNMLMVKRGDKTPSRAHDVQHTGQSSQPFSSAYSSHWELYAVA